MNDRIVEHGDCLKLKIELIDNVMQPNGMYLYSIPDLIDKLKEASSTYNHVIISHSINSADLIYPVNVLSKEETYERFKNQALERHATELKEMEDKYKNK